MQLVTGQPVTAFRDATIQVGLWRLPLMVQDYIGALNVALAMPFLALGGMNAPALRWLSILIGAVTLLLTWRVAWRLSGSVAAACAALLLAVNPTFIFWSRQGIFVTNLTALLFMASLLTGLRWWEKRRPVDLWLTAFLWGLGIYAKLLFVWAIGAMVVVAAVAWGVARWRGSKSASQQISKSASQQISKSASQQISKSASQQSSKAASQRAPLVGRERAIRTWIVAAGCFLLPLIPLILFNLQTGGTLTSVVGSLGSSYYGVDNRAYLPNLTTRLSQLRILLRG
ncbi:MAG: glycosyltransferase family 39 protein, partial [Anaerolineae bacterium]|nr:glycosyltransferase family 39 protein [Anaerolineae bacterium]